MESTTVNIPTYCKRKRKEKCTGHSVTSLIFRSYGRRRRERSWSCCSALITLWRFLARTDSDFKMAIFRSFLARSHVVLRLRSVGRGGEEATRKMAADHNIILFICTWASLYTHIHKNNIYIYTVSSGAAAGNSCSDGLNLHTHTHKHRSIDLCECDSNRRRGRSSRVYVSGSSSLESCARGRDGRTKSVSGGASSLNQSSRASPSALLSTPSSIANHRHTTHSSSLYISKIIYVFVCVYT